MEIKGTLTSKDVVTAQWLHIRPRLAYRIVGIAILLVGILMALYCFSVPPLRDDGWMMLGSLVLIAALAVWMRYNAIRSYRQYKALQRGIRYETVDAGLFAESETGQGTIPWGDFLKWKEGNAMFLLYVSGQLYYLVPKRFFNSEIDVAKFRETLAAKVGRAR